LAFTYDRHGHLSPEVGNAAAAKLNAVNPPPWDGEGREHG
jgi:hypothetical protein